MTKELKKLTRTLTCGPGSGALTWFITIDHGVVNDCENADIPALAILESEGFTEHFRMYDDDGELYYSGLAKPEADFEPLDDFGMPNAGCTEIKYYNKKTHEFETL